MDKKRWSAISRSNRRYLKRIPPNASWNLVSVLNKAHAFPISEECECSGTTNKPLDGQRCSCQEDNNCPSLTTTTTTTTCTTSSTTSTSITTSAVNSSLDEIDGVDDILAVSHVQDKAVVPNSAKTKPPLVRAKTLPAIIAPGLMTILQTQMDCSNAPTKILDDYGSVTPCVDKKPNKLEDCSKKTKGSPAKVTFLVNGTSWKSSSAIDPSSACSATMVTTSPRVSPAHSSSSQINMTGSNNEKQRCDQSSTANSWMGFAKLARFLNQREKEKAMSAAAKRAHCRRTHSLENEDLPVRKASSIDSLVVEPNVEVTTTCLGKEVKSIPPSPSFPTRLERKSPDLQSSPSLHSKLSKSRTGWSRESIEYLVDGLPFTKAERKKLEKFNKINIHLHALFLAVEHQQLEKARTILENVEVDLNTLNNDNFNALDIAVFSQNVPMSKLLLSYGAKENVHYKDSNLCASHLNGMVDDAEQKVDNLATAALNLNISSMSANQVKDHERQLTLWERRRKLLRKMKMGFEQIRPPDPPSSVTLHVIGTNQLKMEIEEPDFQTNAIVTKYKVDWSFYEDFNTLAGTEVIYDLRPTDFTISDLRPGFRYYIRVASGNVKGYSDFKLSCPISAIPSIWRDVDGRTPRSAGRLSMMVDLFNQIRNSRPEYASEIKGIADQLDTPAQQRKHQMKKSIRSLFTPAPKFYKHLKRGVFLASIFYNEDRVLVTTEEYLPIVEVDETYPSSLHTDFHWMMKVACTWDDVKSLRQDMDKSLSSSTVHYRSKLLQAAAQMQTALGVQDLGQFFYKPLKDNNGTIVISTVCYVKDIKSINSISLKWVPISKLRRKVALSGADFNAGNLLLASISEQIQYNQMSSIPLRRGLYLGYLKLKSTMDLIRVMVPEKTPNVLPHYKIRDNPHVSREEWEWLTSLGRVGKLGDLLDDDLEQYDQQLNENVRDDDDNDDTDDGIGECFDEVDNEENDVERCHSQSNRSLSTIGLPNGSELQLYFGRQLLSAAKHLFSILGICKEDAFNHRVYDVEIIELSGDVSFILVFPSVENVCSVPGQSDEFASRQGFVALPVQIFEMAHMSTYQKEFISRYSRLSSILEMDTIMAQHAHREAFSSSEVASAKQRLTQLQEFQAQVDNTWKGMRWIMDVLTYARDKQTNGGVSFILLYERFDSYSPLMDNVGSSHSLSQSPNPSIRSRRSADQVQFLSIKGNSGGGCGSSGYRSSLPSEKMQHLQVPIMMSPTTEPKNWMSLRKGKHGGIPKSYSDSFTAVGIRDLAVAVTDDSESSTYDVVSLTASLKSVSSGELPMDDLGDGSLENIVLPLDEMVHDKTDEDNSEGNAGSGSNRIVGSCRFLKPSSTYSINPSSTTSSSSYDPGVLKVHAAYETGLGGGASIKLHVTPKTTSREVINLVVKQLNMAAMVRGKTPPMCTAGEQLHNYCLVAVIGARERCLRDDFCPLKLQNPWTKGRLYVRMKHDVLAAIQQQPGTNATTAIVSTSVSGLSTQPASL